jgi:hypothetical protein
MSCLRVTVATVLGAYIDRGRSGTEAVKRMMRYMSCAGSAVAFAMVVLESCGRLQGSLSQRDYGRKVAGDSMTLIHGGRGIVRLSSQNRTGGATSVVELLR